MNRDIKFRAWDNKYKYMNYKVLVGMWGEDVLDDKNYTACAMWIDPKNVDYKCEPHWGHFEPYHKDIELMQYTGLKDINGKEIFEGDIIEGGYLNPLTGEFLSRKYIVEYENAQFIGKIISHTPYGDTWLHFIKGEVIGNIYENLELLEE